MTHQYVAKTNQNRFANGHRETYWNAINQQSHILTHANGDLFKTSLGNNPVERLSFQNLCDSSQSVKLLSNRRTDPISEEAKSITEKKIWVSFRLMTDHKWRGAEEHFGIVLTP